MALTDIRNELKLLLEAVAGMGPVHSFERWNNDWTKFLAHFQDETTGRINGCMFSRKATPAERDNYPTIARRHKFIIRIFCSLQDATESELAFQDLLEAIQNKLDTSGTLNETVLDSGPAQIDIAEARMYGTVLCHYGEISFEAMERVFPAY